MMLLLLCWATAATAASSSTSSPPSESLHFLPVPSAQDRASPYFPDHSHLDWTQCHDTDINSAYCLSTDSCTKTTTANTAFKVLSASSSHLHTPENSDVASCHSGIQIKPISPHRWRFLVQITLPDLDPKKGVKLYTKVDGGLGSPRKPFVLGKCYVDAKDGKMKFASDFEDVSLTWLNRSFFYAETMVCSFEIEIESKDKTVAELLKKRLMADSILSAEFEQSVKYIGSHQVLAYNIDSSEKWKTMIENIDKRSNCMIRKIKKVKQAEEPPFMRNFTFPEVITGFNSLGCEDPLARLVLTRGNNLHEVETDFFVANSGYKLFYHDKSKQSPEDAKVPDVANDVVDVSCAVRNCHFCDPLLFFEECEGCFPPSITHPSYHKDCPTLHCPHDWWMFHDGLTRFKLKGNVTCMKSDTGHLGWFTTSGVGVTRAACAPKLNCTIFSPLNDTCTGGDGCVPLLRTLGKTSCPSQDAVLLFNNGSEWAKVGTSLHCDYRMGSWYLGDEPHRDFDHKYPLKCQAVGIVPFSPADPVTLLAFLFIFLCPLLVTFIIVGCGLYILWSRDRWREKSGSRNIKKRPMAKEKPEFDDLTLVRDLHGMDEEVFFRLIEEFQLYSIHERLTFVENMLAGLGMRVSIDHFLAFFHHCVEMETDHRVWRKLVMGYKIIMIAFNQVNKSRLALKLNMNLQKCAHRLLMRIGFDKTYGEDESLVETRNIAFNIGLITYDRTLMHRMYEEAAINGDNADPRRRRQLFAYRSRTSPAEIDEKITEWKMIARMEDEEPVPLRGEKVEEDEDDEEFEKEMAKLKKKNVDPVELRKLRAKRRMKRDGDVEANLARFGPKATVAKDVKNEREEVLKKYGKWREHMIYAMCCGKHPEVVETVLNQIVTTPKYSKSEVVAGFRASVEDCFDMRFVAQEVYKAQHMKLKEKLGAGSPEYKEIFEMIMRYTSIDFFAEDNWLLIFTQAGPNFENNERSALPLSLVTELFENARLLMKQAADYKLPMEESSGDEEEEDGAPSGMEPTSGPASVQPGSLPPTSAKPEPSVNPEAPPTSSLKREGQPTSSQKQGGSNSSPNHSGPAPVPDFGQMPNSGPKPDSDKKQ